MRSVAGILALGVCWAFQAQAAPVPGGLHGDTLHLQVQPSPWSISIGGSLLTGFRTIDGAQGSSLHYATQSLLAVDYQVADHLFLGVQTGVTQYTEMLLIPIRYGVQATYAYPVANGLNLYAKGAVGSQITYHRELWDPEWDRLEVEVPRAFFNLGLGFEWSATNWAIRTGLGYQRQHIRQVNGPDSDFWQQDYLLRRATFDLAVVLRLNKMVTILSE